MAKRSASSTFSVATLLASLALGACSYVPARFVDQAPVSEISDDRPIPIPHKTPFIEPVYLSDVYLRRPIVDALDTERFPYALDVNALDEVPRSSWFDPPPHETHAFEARYAVDGPPLAPVRKEPPNDDGARLVDARGKTYVLSGEIEQLPATSTAAGIIASRLARAVGYRTPETWLTSDGDSRMLATRWPLGVDLGPTDMTYPRRDDNNDKFFHRDRRTLRALGVLAAWLGLKELGPKHLVDVYVGRPGAGHVVHFLTHLEHALDSTDLGRHHVEYSAAGAVRGDPLTNLVTLGLARDADKPAQGTTLEVFSLQVNPNYRLSQPWEPVDRLLPSDGYWMAKRIGAVPDALIDDAIAKAELPRNVATHVRAALQARRRTLLAYWFGQVTPCEVERVEDQKLVLKDEAVAQGVADPAGARYQVRFLDDDGNALAPPFFVGGNVDEIDVPMPHTETRYVVAEITLLRAGHFAPRPMQAHLVQNGASFRVVGVRH